MADTVGYMAFWNEAPQMICVANLHVTPSLWNPAVVDEVFLSESQSSTGKGLTQKQGVIKHSTSFKVSSPMHA